MGKNDNAFTRKPSRSHDVAGPDQDSASTWKLSRSHSALLPDQGKGAFVSRDRRDGVEHASQCQCR